MHPDRRQVQRHDDLKLGRVEDERARTQTDAKDGDTAPAAPVDHVAASSALAGDQGDQGQDHDLSPEANPANREGLREAPVRVEEECQAKETVMDPPHVEEECQAEELQVATAQMDPLQVEHEQECQACQAKELEVTTTQMDPVHAAECQAKELEGEGATIPTDPKCEPVTAVIPTDAKENTDDADDGLFSAHKALAGDQDGFKAGHLQDECQAKEIEGDSGSGLAAPVAATIQADLVEGEAVNTVIPAADGHTDDRAADGAAQASKVY